jgi:hypothetical protein
MYKFSWHAPTIINEYMHIFYHSRDQQVVDNESPAHLWSHEISRENTLPDRAIIKSTEMYRHCTVDVNRSVTHAVMEPYTATVWRCDVPYCPVAVPTLATRRRRSKSRLTSKRMLYTTHWTVVDTLVHSIHPPPPPIAAHMLDFAYTMRCKYRSVKFTLQVLKNKLHLRNAG